MKETLQMIQDEKKVAVKRGLFSGTTSGEVLSPYVIYKVETIWDTWTENVARGERYNRSRSDWFDNVCFQDWFQQVADVLQMENWTLCADWR